MLCLLDTLSGPYANIRNNSLFVYIYFSSYLKVVPAYSEKFEIRPKAMKVECDCEIVIEHVALLEIIEER